MKCFTHADGDATAQCQSCSRGLCATCTRRFTLMLCESCLLKHNAGVATSMYLKLIGTGVLFAMLSWLFLSMRPPTLELGQYPAYIASKLLLAAIFAFALWGWDFLDRHTRHLVAGTPMVWIMYFGIKFMLSVTIGIVVGPYQIYRMIKEVRIARRTSREIADGVV